MHVPERWYIWRCPECGQAPMSEREAEAHDCNVYHADEPVKVEVMPATDQGAVSVERRALEWIVGALKGAIEDGEPTAYDAEDVYRVACEALHQSRGAVSADRDAIREWDEEDRAAWTRAAKAEARVEQLEAKNAELRKALAPVPKRDGIGREAFDA